MAITKSKPCLIRRRRTTIVFFRIIFQKKFHFEQKKQWKTRQWQIFFHFLSIFQRLDRFILPPHPFHDFSSPNAVVWCDDLRRCDNVQQCVRRTCVNGKVCLRLFEIGPAHLRFEPEQWGGGARDYQPTGMNISQRSVIDSFEPLPSPALNAPLKAKQNTFHTRHHTLFSTGPYSFDD